MNDSDHAEEQAPDQPITTNPLKKRLLRIVRWVIKWAPERITTNVLLAVMVVLLIWGGSGGGGTQSVWVEGGYMDISSMPRVNIDSLPSVDLSYGASVDIGNWRSMPMPTSRSSVSIDNWHDMPAFPRYMDVGGSVSVLGSVSIDNWPIR